MKIGGKIGDGGTWSGGTMTLKPEYSDRGH